jgi:hypothetical protein
MLVVFLGSDEAFDFFDGHLHEGWLDGVHDGGCHSFARE